MTQKGSTSTQEQHADTKYTGWGCHLGMLIDGHVL